MFEEFVYEHHDKLKQIALGVRLLSMDAVLKAKSGHCGLPLGGAELGTFLYFVCMNYDNHDPTWFNRDRFVLSAGHGSALQYSLLHFAKFGLSLENLKSFRQLHSPTPGHPEYGHTPGVEYTTGPLGQGLAGAVGMALAERMLAARLNSDECSPIDHRTFVLAGDGCMMEGVSSEASSFAGHLQLSRLIVFYDANNITIDGTIDLAFSENVGKRYEAYGWNVFYADGNDFISLAKAMDKAYQHSCLPNGESAPALIVCTTIAGKGSPKWEGKSKIHGNPMTLEDVNEAKKHLGVHNTTPFFVPVECYEASESLLKYRTQKSKLSSREGWKKFETDCLVHEFSETDWQQAKGKMATRVASGKALALLAQKYPNLVGGSADLAGSNNTTLPNSSFVSAKDFSGRNIHFGVREHAMAAICNGLTVHGGLRAYCATFAVFSDYMRPALRIAALMNIPTIFLFTHDSFGVGEDGPTHQPVEHNMALRCIPNFNVYRSADVLETFAAWENVMAVHTRPSCLLLTRQDVDDLEELQCAMQPNQSQGSHNHAIYMGCEHRKDWIAVVRQAMNIGAYILKDFAAPGNIDQQEYTDNISTEKSAYFTQEKKIQVVLFASGSEVSVALKAAHILESRGDINVRVVSVPNLNAFVHHTAELDIFLPADTHLIGLEAGSSHNFAEIAGRKGVVFGLDTFGLSAPYSVLAEEFGFTPEKFAKFVLNIIQL